MFVNSISEQGCELGAIFSTPTPPAHPFKIFRLHLFKKELRLQHHHKCATPATAAHLKKSTSDFRTPKIRLRLPQVLKSDSDKSKKQLRFFPKTGDRTPQP